MKTFKSVVLGLVIGLAIGAVILLIVNQVSQ